MVYDCSVNKLSNNTFAAEIISERFTGWEFNSHPVVFSALTKPGSPSFLC